MIRDDAIYINRAIRSVLSMVAKRRKEEGTSADSIANEILVQWVESNPEAQQCFEMIKRHTQERDDWIKKSPE